MNLPALYAIVNVDSHGDPVAFVRRLIAAGVELLQLRNKKLSRAEFKSIAQAVVAMRRDIAQQTGREHCSARLIINDDVLLAKELGVDGVHLGQSDLSVLEARKLLGPQRIIGLSTHNFSQVKSAQSEPVNYLGFGPVFESSTKQGHAPVTGVSELQRAAKESQRPIVAIGGISEATAAAVFQAGAKSVAIVSALEICTDLEGFVEKLKGARIAASARGSAKDSA